MQDPRVSKAFRESAASMARAASEVSRAYREALERSAPAVSRALKVMQDRQVLPARPARKG